MHTPLFHTNKFITERAELLNHFFVDQCSLKRNNNVLATDLPQLTNKHLDSINLLSSGIVKIISHLGLNKAQGRDMLSIWIIKIFGN